MKRKRILTTERQRDYDKYCGDVVLVTVLEGTPGAKNSKIKTIRFYDGRTRFELK